MLCFFIHIVKPWLSFVREHGKYYNIKVDTLVVVKLLPTLKHVINVGSQNIHTSINLTHLNSRASSWAFLRWPREVNALQLQKTHANRKSTSKSRKHFHPFDSRWWKCSQHKQIKKHTANTHNTTKSILFAARFFFGCVVSICSVCVVKLTKVVFLICRCFFYLQRVELSRPPYFFNFAFLFTGLLRVFPGHSCPSNMIICSQVQAWVRVREWR